MLTWDELPLHFSLVFPNLQLAFTWYISVMTFDLHIDIFTCATVNPGLSFGCTLLNPQFGHPRGYSFGHTSHVFYLQHIKHAFHNYSDEDLDSERIKAIRYTGLFSPWQVCKFRPFTLANNFVLSWIRPDTVVFKKRLFETFKFLKPHDNKAKGANISLYTVVWRFNNPREISWD